MAHLLGAERVHVEYPTRTVLDEVTIGLDEGDRIGVVGRNGDGKSTLLHILAGTAEPDSGRVTVRGGTTIGVLDQRDDFPVGTTLGQAVVGDRPEYEWAGDARIRDVMAGLLGDLPFDAAVADLSGGQRRRVALAALLTGDHDVLLLDEPTNHLDIEGVAWLARHLDARWSAASGALVVVSHDRWFLDAICHDMWEVHDGVVEPFEGGYAAYVLQRVERDRQAAASEARRQNLMRKELAWLRRGAPARTSKPKFRIDAANELIADEPPVRDAIQLAQMATARLGKDVVDLVDVSAGHDGRAIVEGVEWRIAPGERTGIVGPNGAGKSTLLGVVDGTVPPIAGRVKHGKTVRIRVLSQKLDELDELADERISDVIGRYRTGYTVGDREMTPGQLLERLGFTSQQLSTRIGELSGGQRRRLQLLLILLDEPNVLILDEPTNDLDTDMLTAMEDLLDSWPGTLLVVSHDRYLLERVTDQQYAVLDGRFRHLPGGVDDYLALRAAAERRDADARRSGGTTAASRPAAGVPQTVPTLSGAERRALEKESTSLDRRIGRLGDDIASVHDELAVHDQSDYAGLGAITERLQSLEAERDDAEMRWLEVLEILG